jgi:predicted RNase H-like HicB family nuclease
MPLYPLPFRHDSFCRLHDSFDPRDEEGWIVARVLEVPGAISQGRTREEAREYVLDALRTVLTPNDDLAGEAPGSDREHLHFVSAA